MAPIHTAFRNALAYFIPAPLRAKKPYQLVDLWADVQAGITVAIILVPQAMALALIAGLPTVYGLYAALPGFIASVFGSSRHLSTGPVAIVSFLTFTSLLPLAPPGSTEFILYASLLAFLVGVLQLAMGVCRLGFVMHLIPHSAITGFTSAAAAIIVITQIPTLLGFDAGAHAFVYQSIFAIISQLAHVHPLTMMVGVGSIALLLWFRQLSTKFPGALVLVVVSIAASAFFNFAEYGVAIVKEIPALLPAFTIPVINVSSVFLLLPKAALIAFIGFVEAYAIANAIAKKHKEKIDTNQELVGQGLANIVAGFFKGYPVSGSFMRTAVNVEAGARTAVSAVVVSLATVLVILFCAPLLSFLPRSVLAAIVIVSAASLIKFHHLQETYRLFRTDGVVAYVTFIMAFIFRPDDAIFIGIVLALVLFIRKTVWGAQVTEMGIARKWSVLRAISPHTENNEDIEKIPGCVIARPGMSLYYANAAHILEQIKRLVHVQCNARPPVKTLVIDCSGINFIDSTATDLFADFVRDLQTSGIQVQLLYIRENLSNALRSYPEFPNVAILHNIAEVKQYANGTASPTLSIARTRPERLRA